MRRFITFALVIFFGSAWASRMAAQDNSVKHSNAPAVLPLPTREAKPGLRWWWLGSAVDKENLSWCLGEYAKAGVGAVEITPI